jgi:hypothetical protein
VAFILRGLLQAAQMQKFPTTLDQIAANKIIKS